MGSSSSTQTATRATQKKNWTQEGKRRRGEGGWGGGTSYTPLAPAPPSSSSLANGRVFSQSKGFPVMLCTGRQQQQQPPVRSGCEERGETRKVKDHGGSHSHTCTPLWHSSRKSTARTTTAHHILTTLPMTTHRRTHIHFSTHVKTSCKHTARTMVAHRWHCHILDDNTGTHMWISIQIHIWILKANTPLVQGQHIIRHTLEMGGGIVRLGDECLVLSSIRKGLEQVIYFDKPAQ